MIRTSFRFAVTRFLAVVFTVAIVCSWSHAAVGQDDESSASDANQTGENEDSVRLILMENGQIVYGELSVESISVETEFGTLTIPIDQIVSFTPGLDSHPEEEQKITRMIQELGANEPEVRDNAQRLLMNYGPSIRSLVQQYAEDDDSERRTRINAIIEEFNSMDEDEMMFMMEDSGAVDLIAQDSIETRLFTVVGKISPASFEMTTKFGTLNIALADIRRAQREFGGLQEIRKSLAVSGMNMADVTWKSSGIRVARGDEIKVSADGQIVMSPWGNNATTGPEGNPNYQWYRNNEIAGGALVYRIGTGSVEKAGDSKTFVADRSGVLEFAVGIPQQFANQGYNFPGQYQVKIHVKTNAAR